MVIRGVTVAGLLAIIAFVWFAARPEPKAVEAQAPPPQRVAPPPLFGPRYVESLRGILDMEEADAAALEQRLAADPGNYEARLRLLAYHMRADRVDRPEDRARRAELALWLIEHEPESEILHSPYASFFPGQLTDTEYQRAVGLWQRVDSAPALWNAAHFFGPLDSGAALRYLERTVEADPTHHYSGRDLGMIYAREILNGSPDAQRAKERLEKTSNAEMVAAAVRMFQNEHIKARMLGGSNPQAEALAKHFFDRAKALNPGLDAQWVMPALDPKMVGMLKPGAAPEIDHEAEARAAEGLKVMRRLPIDAFPDLPKAVAETLRGRGCLVPQPALTGPPRNIIQGEFFAKGETAWAAFCSKDGSTDLLVFRDALDPNPMTINTRDERSYLQSDVDAKYIYSREIRPVGRDFIVGHYRAYGGPEPPPIEHQGIDDAFLEKASVTYYYHEGKWLQLQGAD